MLNKIKEYFYLKRQNRKTKKFNKKLNKEFIKPRQDRKIKINKN